jgi:hypothetical protein
VDYDDDGILDFISGSYDPGDIYLFRGLGDGEYAKVETILDEDDQPLVHHPVEFAKYTELKKTETKRDDGRDSDEATSARVASFGSWPAAVDWDDDGDLDILIGEFGGRMYLRLNIGTRTDPKYDRESTIVNADGKPLKEHSHASPVVADWDGDGKWDLVVGSGDGSVGWYKNIGSRSQPEFGPRHQLLKPAADGIFLQQSLKADENPIPGPRAQICVTDYNGDGLLDLIVGDYSDIDWARELNEEEQTELAELVQQRTETIKKMGELQKILFNDDSPDSDNEETESEYDQIMQKYEELEESKKKYAAESRSASFIWLYLRDHVAMDETFVSAAAKVEKSNKSADADPGPDDDQIKTKEGPVSTDIKLEPTEDDAKRRLSVSFEIEPEWHMYATEESDAGVNFPTKIELTLPDGIQAPADWQKPAGEFSRKNPGAKIYTGSVTFTRNLEVEDSDKDREIEVLISYQVCNEDLCLPPKKIRKSLQIPANSSD